MVETFSRRLKDVLPDNPVLTKEMRVRMRGSRAYWLMFGYIGFLAMVMLLTYWGWLQNAGAYGGYSRVSDLGNRLYLSIYLTQVCLAFLITPAITSGSITLEKEQRTLEMLTMSRLSLPKIVLGKLLSGVLFTALLLVTSLPLVSLTFTFGGIDPAMVFGSYALLFTGSILMGSLGVMCSAVSKQTTQAIIYTYGTAIVGGCLGGIFYGNSLAKNTVGTSILELCLSSVSVNLYGGRFLGFAVPEGFGFLVISLLLSLIFVMVAVSRLEAKPERRTGQLRGLMTVLFASLIYSAFRWIALTGDSYPGPLPMTKAMILPAVFLMWLVPIFCTGERNKTQAKEGDRFFWRGFTPQGWREGAFNSGLPFVLMLALLSVGLFYAAGLRGLLALPVFTLFASLFGFGRLCAFLSVMFRNRWASWLFASLFYGYISVIPQICYSVLHGGGRPPLGFFVSAAYFDPVSTLVENNSHFPLHADALLFGVYPVWILQMAVWSLVLIGTSFGIRALSRKHLRSL